MSQDEYRKPKRRRGGVVLVVVVALLVVVAAGGVFAWKSLSGSQQIDVQTKTHDEPVSKLVVEGSSGAVEVVAGDGDDVKVETEREWRGDSTPGSDQKVSGETLRVKSIGCEGIDLFGLKSCSVNFRIEVPADIELEAKVDSGELTTSGVTGAQDLACDSGDVSIDGSGKKLSVKADSGDVTGENIEATTFTGEVDSGDLNLAFTRAPKKAKVGADSGDVGLSIPKIDAGYDVAKAVNSGDATIDVKSKSGSPHKIDATVDSGNLTVDYSLLR